MNSKIFLAITLLCFIGLPACKKDLGIKSNSKIFKVELFKSNLQTQLNGVLGYAFVINQNGQWVDSTSFGLGAINATGGTNISASVLHDVNIASVTKALTGMAAIKLLEQKGISLEDNIGPWLPDYWVKHAQKGSVKFRELLTHTSGIQESSTSWDSLKAAIARPADGSKSYVYANSNFALFRALLPRIYDKSTFDAQQTNSAAFETWMSNRYISIMQELVFTPAGVSNAICNNTPGKITMQAFNELNNPPLVARSPGDWTELCGGGGYYLSTMEMARVMAFLAHTDDILTNAQKDLMDDNLYGWDPGDSFNTLYGRVHGKDGALFWENNGDNSLTAGDSGLQTWVGKFPNDVELALSINSIGSTWRSLPTIIKNAYEAAWVEE